MALLSKIQLGGVIYDLKDAKAREDLASLIASLGDAAYLDVDASVTEGGTGVVTGGKIKEYVDAQVGAIHKFDVVVVDTLPTASEDTMYKLYLIPKAGSEEQNIKEEWITIRSGSEGSYTYAWEKIGDTAIDLTDYLTKEATVADVAFGDDKAITKAELETALDLKDLAHADSASGEVAGQTFTGISAQGVAQGSLSGTLGYTTPTITSTGSYKPEGGLTGTLNSAGSITVTLGTDSVNAQLTTASYTPDGTVGVTLANATFDEITGVGTEASFTEGTFTPGTFTPVAGDYNTDAMKMHIASGSEITGDVTAETLIIENAATASAIASATYVPSSKAADTFTPNQVATKASHTVGVATATFTGTEEAGLKITGVTYDKSKVQTATFNPAALDLTGVSLAGTTATISVSGAYDKANIGTLAFAGAATTVTVADFTVTAKTVTVTAD